MLFLILLLQTKLSLVKETSDILRFEFVLELKICIYLVLRVARGCF